MKVTNNTRVETNLRSGNFNPADYLYFDGVLLRILPAKEYDGKGLDLELKGFWLCGTMEEAAQILNNNPNQWNSWLRVNNVDY